MGDRWVESGRTHRGERDRGPLAFGVLLIVLGIAFLISEQTGIDWGRTGWPLFVIVPGLALLWVGFVAGGDGGLGAAIPGGIVTSVGLLLAFQDATNTYASWAYAWALVAPGSIGVTLFLYGLVHRRGDLVESGMRTAAVAAVLFVAFGLFFENLIGIGREGGSTVMQDAMPILAVGLGVLLVLANLIPSPRRARDRWTGPGGTPPGAGAPPAPGTPPGAGAPPTATSAWTPAPAAPATGATTATVTPAATPPATPTVTDDSPESTPPTDTAG